MDDIHNANDTDVSRYVDQLDTIGSTPEQTVGEVARTEVGVEASRMVQLGAMSQHASREAMQTDSSADDAKTVAQPAARNVHASSSETVAHVPVETLHRWAALVDEVALSRDQLNRTFPIEDHPSEAGILARLEQATRELQTSIANTCMQLTGTGVDSSKRANESEG